MDIPRASSYALGDRELNALQVALYPREAIDVGAQVRGTQSRRRLKLDERLSEIPTRRRDFHNSRARTYAQAVTVSIQYSHARMPCQSKVDASYVHHDSH